MIRVERLYKSFERPVLRGIELVVPDGGILGVIGPAGAGKSLLLRAIAGLIEPDAGSITIGGREMVASGYSERLNLQARLGMAFQNIALFDHLDVFDNISFPLVRRGVRDRQELEQRVSQALETVGLAGFERRRVQGLSGGQKRRVGLARAAIHRPAYLLYDEPAAGLDPVTSSRTFALLRKQQESIGATIVVISSDVERLLPVVDRLVLIHEGRTIFAGAPEQAPTARHPFVAEFLAGIQVATTKIVVENWGSVAPTPHPAVTTRVTSSPPATLQGASLLAKILQRPPDSRDAPPPPSFEQRPRLDASRPAPFAPPPPSSSPMSSPSASNLPAPSSDLPAAATSGPADSKPQATGPSGPPSSEAPPPTSAPPPAGSNTVPPPTERSLSQGSHERRGRSS